MCKLFAKKTTWIIIFLVLLGLGFFWLKNIDDYVPGDKYEYTVHGQRVLEIRNLVIHHNFETNKGGISFDISKANYEKNREVAITFSLPRNISNKNIKVYVNGKENSEWRLEGEDAILIYGFEKDNSRNYIINYSLNINPRGEFLIHRDGLDFNGREAALQFDLGKNYFCLSDCTVLGNMQFASFNTDKEIRLNLDKESMSYRLILNTAKDVRSSQGLALGLVVSALFAILTTLKEILENSGKNKG